MRPTIPEPTCCSAQFKFRRAAIADGIAQCRRSLALDRNLADAHGFIGLGKYQSGRSEEVEGAHSRSAPAVPTRYARLPVVHVCRAGQVEHPMQTSKPSNGFAGASRPIEITRCRIFTLRPRWRWWGISRRRDRSLRPDWPSIPASPSVATASTPKATIRSIWRDASATLRVCAWPGCRKDDSAKPEVTLLVRQFASTLPSGHARERQLCARSRHYRMSVVNRDTFVLCANFTGEGPWRLHARSR